MVHHKAWPETAILALEAQLKKRINGLPTFSQIATNLGKTNASVRNYINRHFPQYKGQSYYKFRPPRPLPNLPPGEKKAPTPVKFAEGGPDSLKEFAAPLDYGQCAYVHGDPGLGDWRYCGHPIASGSSYCPFHKKATTNQQAVDSRTGRMSK